jgi:pimeloyl-ACP methyl ester carboxylesterase
MEHAIRTPDGRTLAVSDLGDPDGMPVVAHGGTPHSRHVYPHHVAAAAARGLRLISYDRPGYGGSDPLPGRTVADCAVDVRAICAALGLNRIGTWGGSGGGPHVLACAALLPDLVAGAVATASLAPYGAEGLDWFAGMGQDNIDDMRLMLTDPAAARAKLDRDREGMLAVTAADLHTQLSTVLTPVDRAVATSEAAEHLVFTIKEGLAPGGEGWWEDGLAMAVPWGFDLADITVPVLLMHGRHDMFVPIGHGEWLAKHIPGVEARLLDDDGHLTIAQGRVGEIFDWLAQRLRAPLPG